MSVAIGTVTYRVGDQAATATLNTDNTWTFAGDPSLVEQLRMCAGLIDLDDYGGPACGPFGPSFLHELAEMCGGTLHLEDLPGPPEGTIF